MQESACIGEVSEKLIRSAQNAREYADIVLVGDEEQIRATGTELEIIHSTEPSKKLVQLLMDKDIDGAVRGHLALRKRYQY